MDRFEKGEVLGEGAFGVVYRATERSSGRQVAIKKMRLSVSREGVSFSSLREIKLLRELQHPNVVQLLEVFAHKQNLYLAFEFCASDLEVLVQARHVALPADCIKSLLQQMLAGVAALHDAWLLHRDLKPGNVLLTAEGVVRLTDFGLARPFASPSARPLTAQVVTRWYRAPELLFGARHYGPAVDMWSIGCIFAELMLRMPYFAGASDLDQLGKIFHALGTPRPEQWPGVAALPDYVPFAPCAGTPLAALFPAATPAARDLLGALLRFDPATRPSAHAALQHAYFSEAPAPAPPSRIPVVPKRAPVAPPPAIAPQRRTDPSKPSRLAPLNLNAAVLSQLPAEPAADGSAAVKDENEPTAKRPKPQ